MRFLCAGAAVLAVSAVTANLQPQARTTSSFLLLGSHQSQRLTSNQFVGDKGRRRTVLNARVDEAGEDATEGSKGPSIDTQVEFEISPYGFSDFYETLRADAYGIAPAGEVPYDSLAEEQNEFHEETSSSDLASLAQLHDFSPPGSGQRKSGGAEQTSSAMSVLRALSRPFVAIGSAALKATRELRKYLSNPKLSCSLEVQDTKIGGNGSPIVAKAISRLGRVRKTSFLDKVNQELELFFPINEEIEYDCVDFSQKIVLKRGYPLGAGAFGFVVPFTSSHGAQYAGKLFQIGRTEKHTMNNVRKQLNILSYLPSDMDAATASHRLRLAFPLCIVVKRWTSTVMELPTRGKLLNAIVLYPLLRGDLSYLTASLLPTRDEDRNVLLSLTQQVVRAVNDLHKLRLVHLDIKLQNFLVTEKGSVLTGDLDGVKPFGSPVVPIMFTAALAAPEVARIVLQKDRTAGAEPTMDSWSLGISIYGIWCAGYPFSQEFRKLPPAEQMERLHKEPFQTIVFDEECAGIMPPEVFNLITQFLKPDPKDRLTPKQALASHPAMALQVPGAEGMQTEVEETLPLKEPEEELEPLSEASTASTEEAGRPASLSSSYVFVKRQKAPAARSFQQQSASIFTPTNSGGYRFVGSHLREPKPLANSRQQQQPSGSP